MIIVPSLLSDSVDVIQSNIHALHSQTKLRRVQIDIVDPDFEDEITIQPIDVLDVDLHQFEIDVHLMTNDPINDVVECSQIPGINTIIAQIERMTSQTSYIEHVKSFGVKSGLSLDIHTQVEEINEKNYKDISILQVMGNKAGRQGQPFLKDIVLPKIQQLKKIRDENGFNFLIAVDIGMNPENAKLCATAGADMITPGSYIWNAKNIQTAIEAYS